MAYKTIYQITTEPLEENEFVTENDFIDDWFIGSIAASVTGSNIDRRKEIRIFREWLAGKEIVFFNSDDSFVITPGGKEKYFKGVFKKFKEAVQKAADITLEEFAGGVDCPQIVGQIKTNFCEKLEDYVYSDEFEPNPIPFDEFMRNAEPGKQYYINGIVKYHW